MKLQSILLALPAVTSTQAFAPLGGDNRKSVPSSLRAEIGESGVAFENVAREWRCKVRIYSILGITVHVLFAMVKSR